MKSEKSVIKLSFYFEDVVRVSYSENGDFDKRQGEGMLLPDLPLLKKDDNSLTESDEEIIVSTKTLTVHVCRASGAVKVFKLSDGAKDWQELEAPLFSEACESSHSLEKFDVYKSVGQIKTEEVKTADGVKKRVLAADKEYVESLYHTRVNLAFAPDEKLFGLGQMEEGVWNYRGTTQYLHQANKKIAIPFLISSRGYGLLFTTQSPSVFSDSQYGSYFYTNADYYLDYFVILLWAMFSLRSVMKVSRRFWILLLNLKSGTSLSVLLFWTGFPGMTECGGRSPLIKNASLMFRPW